MTRNGLNYAVIATTTLLLGLADAASAQGLPAAVSPAGTAAATAMTVQGAINGVPVSSSDPSNLPFSDWTPYGTGTSYGTAALAGVRSIEMNLTAAGSVTFTSLAGNVMTLPYATVGLYQLPFVPARVDLGGGAAASIWMLR